MPICEVSSAMNGGIPVDEAVVRKARRALAVILIVPALLTLVAIGSLVVMLAASGQMGPGRYPWLVQRPSVAMFGVVLVPILFGLILLGIALLQWLGLLAAPRLRAARPVGPGRVEPTIWRSRRGSELTGALIGATVVSIALLMAIQAYYQSSIALARTTNRARALMVLESQAEALRAAGYSALPAPGTHAMPTEMLRGLPGATGSLAVSPGPAPSMRTVSFRMTWPERNGPPGEARLVFAMGARGLDP
jgi:hypothetical protein